MKIAPLILLAAICLSPLSRAGEVVTIENGTPIYNVGPVLSLAKSGLSKSAQLQKIKTWINETQSSIDTHGANLAADVFLRVLAHEITRLQKLS